MYIYDIYDIYKFAIKIRCSVILLEELIRQFICKGFTG